MKGKEGIRKAGVEDRWIDKRAWGEERKERTHAEERKKRWRESERPLLNYERAVESYTRLERR